MAASSRTCLFLYILMQFLLVTYIHDIACDEGMNADIVPDDYGSQPDTANAGDGPQQDSDIPTDSHQQVDIDINEKLSQDVTEDQIDIEANQVYSHRQKDIQVSQAETFRKLVGLDESTTNKHELQLEVPSFLNQRSVNATIEVDKKIKCNLRNVTENETVEVRLVNSTELLERLSYKNDSSGNCAVVLFYAPWCMFCAEIAPQYNALARVFPRLDVLAIDAIHFSGLNSRFGTIAVPNILIFHNSKAVARFNNSMRTLENITSFVANITGVEANTSVLLSSLDYEGVLPSVPSTDSDYLLYLAWLFILSLSATIFSKSSTGQRIFTFLSNLGKEHQHIE